ncbi:MAG: hypothetical protein RMX63_31590, partial [Aulosira sp. ZfuCHP01]|nr:hypothetical protein [Aulosira sp. ZfuCHP01]
ALGNSYSLRPNLDGYSYIYKSKQNKDKDYVQVTEQRTTKNIISLYLINTLTRHCYTNKACVVMLRI